MYRYQTVYSMQGRVAGAGVEAGMEPNLGSKSAAGADIKYFRVRNTAVIKYFFIFYFSNKGKIIQK